MIQPIGSAYQTAALSYGPAGFPANVGSNRQRFTVPRFTGGAASWRHSLYASTFLIAYLGVFFAAGYAALSLIEWAWTAIVP